CHSSCAKRCRRRSQNFSSSRWTGAAIFCWRWARIFPAGTRRLTVRCSSAGNAGGQPVYAESGGGVMIFCGTDHFDLVNQQWAAAEGNASAVSSANSQAVATTANDNWTHGRKNVLYMRVNFPDDLTEPVSEAAAYATMNG